MRILVFSIFLIFLSMLSCKSKDKASAILPLPEEKVINVLIDMHYAEEAARINRKTNQDSLVSIYTKEVLEIHKIDSIQLEGLMTYLESNLDEFYSLEQKVHLKIKELKEK